jgi:hypothetical protein
MEGSNLVTSFLGFSILVADDVLIALCDCHHHERKSLPRLGRFGEWYHGLLQHAGIQFARF